MMFKLGPFSLPCRPLHALAMILLVAGCSSPESVEQRLARAEQLQAAGDLRAALLELKSVAQDVPESLPARRMLAELYVLVGDGASGQKEVERAIDLGLEPGLARRLLAKSLILRREMQLAIDGIEAVDGWEQQAALVALYGEARLNMGELARAKIYFEDALKLDNAQPDALLGMARVAAIEGEFDKAAEYVASTLAVVPSDGEVHLLKGYIAERQKEWSAAQEAYQEAAKLNPFKLDGTLGYVRGALELKQFTEADAALNSAANRFANDARLIYLRALSRYLQRDADAAIDLFQQVLSLEQQHAMSQYYLGILLYDKGDLEQAERLLHGFLARYPNQLGAIRILASIQLRRHEPEAVLELLSNTTVEQDNDPQVASLRASALMAMGKIDDGIAELQRAVEFAPQDKLAQANLTLAQAQTGKLDDLVGRLQAESDREVDTAESALWLVSVYLSKEQWDKAVGLIESLPPAKQNNVLVHNALGMAHAGKENWAQARAAFNAGLALAPESTLIEQNLASLELSTGDLEAAAKRIDRLQASASEKDTRVLTLAARLATIRGEHDDAVLLLEKVRLRDPSDFSSRRTLAAMYLERGRNEKALDAAREAVQLRPSDGPTLVYVTEALNKLGRLEEADVVATQATAIAPDLFLAQYFAGTIKMRLGRFADAQPYIERALKTADPTNTDVLATAAFNAMQLGDTEQARTYLSRLQELEGDTTRTLDLLGDLAVRDGEFDTAIQHFSGAEAREPSAATAAKLNQTQMRAGKIDEALAGLKAAHENYPRDVTILILLATLYESRGDTVDALASYEKAIAIDANSTVALNNAALLKISTGQIGALAMARQAYELAPEDANVIDTYAWVMAKSGQPADSLRFFAEAEGLSKDMEQPAEASFQYHYAIAEILAGERQSGVDRLRQLVGSGAPFPERADAEKQLPRFEAALK